jgi:type I restriction enzyme S subunit
MPEGWVQTALGSICRFQAGDAFGRDEQGRSTGDHPFIKVSDMNLVGNELYIARASNWVSDGEAQRDYRLHPKDAVVFAKIGIALTYNRRRRLTRPTAIDNNMMSAVCLPDVDPVWFYYLLSTIDFNLISSGSALPYLTVKDLSRISVEVPSTKDQEAIASVLGALDDKIELNRRMNETLEAMARAIFRDWFVTFGPTRAKMAQRGEVPSNSKAGGEDPQMENIARAPYLAPDIWSLFPDRLDEEGKPEGWSERRVEDILELAYGKALKASERTAGPIPVYGSGGITGYHNEALVEGPSIIVGRKGTVGTLYWEDRSFFPIDTVFYVKPKAPLTFCYYHLQILGLEAMNTDAAVPGLNRNNVYRLPVPWSANELRDQFDDLVTSFRRRIQANAEESRTLAATRDLLLPKLMSGEVRVKDAEKTAGEAI